MSVKTSISMIELGMRPVGPFGMRGRPGLSAYESSRLPIRPGPALPKSPSTAGRPARGRHSSLGMNLPDNRDASVFPILHRPRDPARHVVETRRLCRCRVEWVPSTGSRPSSSPGLPAGSRGRAQARASGHPALGAPRALRPPRWPEESRASLVRGSLSGSL